MNKLKYPSISSSLIIFLILILFTIIFGAPFMLLPNIFDWLDKDVATVFAYVIPMLATIYLVYHKVIKKEKLNTEIQLQSSIFNFTLGSLNKYFLIIPIALIMMFWVDFFASLIPMPDWAIKLFEEAFNLSIPNIVMITIFAPLLEEVLVRGLVLRGYLQNYTPNKAIIASAIFFGVIHLNPWQFVAGFVSGLYLGYLYYKTKSLTPSILVHFINNSLSVVFMMFYTEVDASFKEIIGDTSYYPILIISLVLGYVLVKKLNVVLNKEYGQVRVV